MIGNINIFKVDALIFVVLSKAEKHMLYGQLVFFFIYLLMKHAPSLESNTTCCKLGRECRTCPYPGAIAAFLVHSFL